MHPAGGGRFVGDDVWWLEAAPRREGPVRDPPRRRRRAARAVERPHPGARVRRRRVDGDPGRPASCSPSSPTSGCTGSTSPVASPSPLTPEPPQPAAWRYGELQILRPGEIWCVREQHAADGTVTRDIAAVPIDGSAADDASRIRSVVGGSHFLAGAADLAGRRAGWPGSPGSTRRCRGTAPSCGSPTCGDDGTCGPHRTLLGATDESILQPEWRDADDALRDQRRQRVLEPVHDRPGRARRQRGRAGRGRPRRPAVAARRALVPRRWPTAGCSPCARSAPTRSAILDPATGELRRHRPRRHHLGDARRGRRRARAARHRRLAHGRRAAAARPAHPRADRRPARAGRGAGPGLPARGAS